MVRPQLVLLLATVGLGVDAQLRSLQSATAKKNAAAKGNAGGQEEAPRRGPPPPPAPASPGRGGKDGGINIPQNKKGDPVIPGTDSDSDPLWLGWHGVLAEGVDTGADDAEVDAVLCERAGCSRAPARGRRKKGDGGVSVMEDEGTEVDLDVPRDWSDLVRGGEGGAVAKADEEYDPVLDMSEEYHYDPVLLGRRGEPHRKPMPNVDKEDEGKNNGMAKMGKSDVLDKNARRMMQQQKTRALKALRPYPDWTTGAQIVIADDDLPSGTACEGSDIRSILIEVAQVQHGHTDALSTLAAALGVASDAASVDAALSDLCNNAAMPPSEALPFGRVTERGYQFDKNYFNGGTSWNHGMGGISRSSDMGRLESVKDGVHTAPIEFPSYLPNFDNACEEIKTVMCCFVHEVDNAASSGSVNPISESKANADVCYHDMSSSPVSARVYNGYAIYHDGRELNENTDQDAHCIGFTWADAASDPFTNQYLGNALAHAGMIDGPFRDGLAGNAPGGPMCACLDQMASVTTSACMETVLATAFIFLASGMAGASAKRAVDFRDCQSDLLTHVNQVHASSESVLGTASSKLVGDGNCTASVHTSLVESGSALAPYSYTTGTAWWSADPTAWTPLVGKGDLYHPDEGSDHFRTLWESSSAAGTGGYPIIRRVCKSCSKSHRDVYYIRLTPVPPSMDLFEYLKNRWSSQNNVMGVDFRLYSTYQDARADDSTEAWKYCEHSDLHGFPFECGPEEGTAVEKQWASFVYGGTYANDVAFYLENKAAAAAEGNDSASTTT